MRLLELGNFGQKRGWSVRDAALAPMRDLLKLIQQPVNLSMRQGTMKLSMSNALTASDLAMQVVRAIGGRAPTAPDLHRQAFSGSRRPLNMSAQLRHAHRPRRPHPQQHHTIADTGAQNWPRHANMA